MLQLGLAASAVCSLGCTGVAASASNPSWRPELALVEYSPKKANDHPEGPEPLNEGNI